MRLGTCHWLRSIGVLSAAIMVSACSSKPTLSDIDRSGAGSDYGATASSGGAFVPSKPKKSPSKLYAEANVKKAYIPKGRHGRKERRRLNPKYITIHSTQNYSSSADAWRHSKALNNGKLRARKRRGGNRIGYLTWHYTVDQYRCVQHLPTNEQGEHADFDGPGNNHSLAIEMCENRGNSRRATMERTAKLTAWLMYKYNIPLRKVVPHYHWRRKGLAIEHKNCPHFLLDNGVPGAKWQAYLARINKHYKSITPGGVRTTPRPTSMRTVAAIPRPAPTHTVTRTSSAPRPASVSRPSTKPRTVSTRSTTRPKASSSRYHTVKKGDTLYALSRRYKTSVSSIQRANGMNGTVIGIGKKLKIPTS